jgi:uncharacterized small protein (DUF1192 family)
VRDSVNWGEVVCLNHGDSSWFAVTRRWGPRLIPLFLILVRGLAECQTSSVDDTAVLIGVSPELGELRTLEKTARDSLQNWKMVALSERIDRRVLMSSLEVDATVALIDNEIARATEVRGFLADKRDRKISRANLLSALLGGGLGATSAGLQLSSARRNSTVATGIAGGVISSALALYGIRAERGGTKTLDADSNMLAPFFDLPESPSSGYPPAMWTFLSEVAPSDPDQMTRRERLIHTWLELKRLDSLTTSSGRVKIEHVASMPSQHLKLTVDDLEDRIAMLQDVRAKLSYLKRDLGALMASLPNPDLSEIPRPETEQRDQPPALP